VFPVGFGGFGGGFGGGYGGGYGGGTSAPVASTPVAENPVAGGTQLASSAPAPAASDAVIPASYAAPSSPATGTADLVVEDLHMVAPATLIAGPAYTVKFRNQGTMAAGPFRVGIFAALDGRLTASRAVVDVSGLEAGQSSEVTLRLPQSAVMLVSASGHSGGFDKLGVMVDVDGRLPESDKTNNAAVLDRSVLEAAQ
jgi:hypothetical protein